MGSNRRGIDAETFRRIEAQLVQMNRRTGQLTLVAGIACALVGAALSVAVTAETASLAVILLIAAGGVAALVLAFLAGKHLAS